MNPGCWVPNHPPPLEDFLADVQGLSTERLYSEIERLEEALGDQFLCRREAEGALQVEVQRLHAEVNALQRQAAGCWNEVEAAAAARDVATTEFQQDAESMRRELHKVHRGTEFTRKLVAQAGQHQQVAESLQAQKSALEAAVAARRREWQDANLALRKAAADLDDLEREKSVLEAACGRTKKTSPDAQSAANAAAVRELIFERERLQKALHKTNDALELKRLLDEERLQLGRKELESGKLLDEIANLEESADDVELKSQQRIAELKAAFERGSTEVLELQLIKRQTDERLYALWSALRQQRHEEACLGAQLQEQDAQTMELQARMNTLIAELRDLEQLIGTYTSGPAPLPAEEAEEEGMMRAFAAIRQQRRGAQHHLVCKLARCKLLERYLAAEREEEQVLLEQLRPMLGLLMDARSQEVPG